MKKYAVIVAGGMGTRMQSNLPKQFMLVNDKPVLYYSIRAFIEAYPDIEIILVLPLNYTDMGQEVIDAYFEKERIKITAGGETRFQSVKNGLSLIDDESIIFVHDAVRCMVSTELIHRCYEMALDSGTAIPVVKSRDSVRLLTEEGNDAVERDKVMLVQTPQVFHSKILLPAFQIDFKDRFTDEAMVVEAYGMKVSLVEGEERNLKITTPQDFELAKIMLSKDGRKEEH